jgi:uncharacterized protein YndB with AHSA1/START domain
MSFCVLRGLPGQLSFDPEGGDVSTLTETGVATQVYHLYVKAEPEAIWNALTRSEWTDRYGYRGRAHYELVPGGAYRAYATDEMRAQGAPEVVIEGEVIEADPPRRLVQTWHALFDPDIAAEPATRLTIELEDAQYLSGVTRLTLTQEFDGAPTTAAIVGGAVPEMGGGWAFVLSDLKTLLETGNALPGC